MHRCLEIDEIQHLICKQTREGHPHLRVKTLLSLALTCRSFREPALDSLYYKLDDLWPLVKCLPRDAWEVISNPNLIESWKRIIVLRRALNSSDVALIRKYNSRIQILSISNSHHRMVAAGVLQALRVFFPEDFLPKLKMLTFLEFPNNDSFFQFLPIFLSPTLISLKVRFEVLDTQTGSLLDSLPSSLHPSSNSLLHSIDLEAGRIHLSSPPASFNWWYGLCRLQIGAADFNAFLQVSCLPNLRTLILRHFVSPLNDIDQRRFNNVPPPFPELHSLEISGASLATGHKLLPSLRHSKLNHLSVNGGSYLDDMEELTDTASLSSFIESVGKYCNPAFLTTLHASDDLLPPSGVSFSSIVAPLRHFSKFKSVQLRLCDSVEVTAQDVIWMGESWPNLTTLRLTSSRPVYHPPSKLFVLASFATACPKLRRLDLEVGELNLSDRMDIFKSLQQLKEPNISLKYLGVDRSPIKSKEFVATFLHELFPNLAYIDSAPRQRESRYNSRWQKIGQILLPMLRMTTKRAQHRFGINVGKTELAGDTEDWSGGDLSRLEHYWSPNNEPENDESDGDGGGPAAYYLTEDGLEYDS